MSRFIWMIAHNALSNYYWDTAKSMIGVSIDEVPEPSTDQFAEISNKDNGESILRLRGQAPYANGKSEKINIYVDSAKLNMN